MRDLWDLLSSEEVRERTTGGFDSVQEAPFLLAFLRQLTNQGWGFPIRDECAGPQNARPALRVLRHDPEPSYTSRGRGLDEQQPGESANPLRLLSQVLAHHAEACWGLSGWENALSFPLTENAPSRVVRLRAYGNAIIPQVAAEFIQAFNDSLDRGTAGRTGPGGRSPSGLSVEDLLG